MATKSTATATTDANRELVDAYLDLAGDRNSSTWLFFIKSLDYSVRVVAESIKQGQKESGFTLSDVTPSKAQHFPTLQALQDKFGLSEVMPFSKAISLAVKADKGLTSTKARKAIESADTLEGFLSVVPKRKGSSARPNAEGFEGSVSESVDMYAMIYDYAQALTPADRVAFAKQLLDLAKVIKVMDTVTA